jgi:hypothetical protein
MNDHFNNELNKIPKPKIYEKNLNELWKLTKKNKYENKELLDLYFEKSNLIPGFQYPIEPIDINKLEFFRCRVIDEKKENINLITTFSYPPPALCKENGRANIIGRPVFYCTDHPGVAIYESKPENGNINYLSVWKTRFDREIKISPIISQNIPKSNIWSFLAFEIIKLKEKHKNISELLEPLYDFFNKVFLEETHPYQLSSWLSNYLLYENNIFDSLLFESIESKSLHCNWAFHPNIVDKYFILDKVYKFENFTLDVEKRTYSNPDKIPCEIGEITNENIVWRKFIENDLKVYPFKLNYYQIKSIAKLLIKNFN